MLPAVDTEDLLRGILAVICKDYQSVKRVRHLVDEAYETHMDKQATTDKDAAKDTIIKPIDEAARAAELRRLCTPVKAAAKLRTPVKASRDTGSGNEEQQGVVTPAKRKAGQSARSATRRKLRNANEVNVMELSDDPEVDTGIGSNIEDNA